MNFLAISQVMAEGGSGDILGNLGINSFLLVAQIVNFILLLLFLNALMIKPIMRGLENRRKRIEESLANAAKADERLANVEKDYQARMAEAEAAAAKIRADALQGAQAELDNLRKAALADADRIREQARLDALAERNQTLAQLRAQVAALAMAAANKIIGDSLDAQRQKALIDDFFSKVPAGLITDLKADGASVVVTSALPLSADEQARVKADLAQQLGQIGEFSFEVDPAILGGLVVRVGDKVIDGSVAGRMNALRQSLGA
ncbi:MAG: F0F1 ATP synthase subunit B [Anaerolineae bacterium]|nr:F0F1 ATP synthase subunit B [Thermoflexales bacterium]MDW8407075.1 F0F1 ATP synthase subunit B [Anaerolineae bacterium]